MPNRPIFRVKCTMPVGPVNSDRVEALLVTNKDGNLTTGKGVQGVNFREGPSYMSPTKGGIAAGEVLMQTDLTGEIHIDPQTGNEWLELIASGEKLWVMQTKHQANPDATQTGTLTVPPEKTKRVLEILESVPPELLDRVICEFMRKNMDAGGGAV